ncbi:hypothetical protein AVEN_19787-1 [Araneus ventricosus]|uniref:Uncharacterized protein n=1 Tax=Araneus ventricosus TaxID=182803 RepID=A0A4Y2HBW9_ARAVE|nr:hypothetical protein AVEN_19787-1 [Araneus ventricosus]
MFLNLANLLTTFPGHIPQSYRVYITTDVFCSSGQKNSLANLPSLWVDMGVTMTSEEVGVVVGQLFVMTGPESVARGSGEALLPKESFIKVKSSPASTALTFREGG